MTIFADILLILCMVSILSQFGSRLSARNSVVWWAMAAFLIVASIDPTLYEPITRLLGIQLVSNFVMATMILFLFFQSIDLTAESAKLTRKQRQIVSAIATDEFLTKYKRKSAEPGNTTGKKRALIILPCYNEEESLPKTITALRSLIDKQKDDSNLEIDFCIINDGSLDGSAVLLERLCPDSYVSHKTNVGVAGVLLTGFAIGDRIAADYVLQCDSDGQHPIEIIPDLIRYADHADADMLIGSRFVSSEIEKAQSTTRFRVLGIVVIRAMLRFFGHGARILDPTSGFRVYSTKARKHLIRNMPDDYPEPESVAILSLAKAKIVEYPVEMLPRESGESSIHGLKTLRFMVKVLTALLGLRLRSLFPA
jgi:hypothetical protein